MPSIHVDDDGALTITLDPSEVSEVLAGVSPAILLAALGRRFEVAREAPQPEPRRRPGQRGPDRRQRRSRKGADFGERILEALASGEWTPLPDICAAMGRKTITTGDCGIALRGLVSSGSVEVAGRGAGRQWRRLDA